MVAHHDQGGAIQQALPRRVFDELVVGVVAQLGIREVIVGETRLPDEGEVELRGELDRRFARVVQDAVEGLPGADAEIGVQFVGVADITLGGDAVRSQIVVRRLLAESRFQIIERGHAAGVLAEHRAITGCTEFLPQERALVESFVRRLPAEVPELVLVHAAQHRDQVRVCVIGDFGVAQHLHGTEGLKRFYGLRHHPVKVHPGNRVEPDNEDAETIVDEHIRSQRLLASLLHRRLTR